MLIIDLIYSVLSLDRFNSELSGLHHEMVLRW